jgi:Ca2+-binding EF-hand superfamily protein
MVNPFLTLIKTVTQLHVRQIITPAKGFSALAEDNEAFISDDNMMLSFQPHPEIMGEFATFVMRHGDSYAGKGMNKEQVEETIQRLGDEQDGLVMLEKVLEWVREPEAYSSKLQGCLG